MAIGLYDTVYIGTYDHTVLALDGKTGLKRWECKVDGVVYTSPAIGSDGTVYAGSLSGDTFALDGLTGQVRWRFRTGAIVDSSPAIDEEDRVYIGSLNNKVYALDGVTGKTISTMLLNGNINASPTLGTNGLLYVGTYNNKFYAIKASSPVQIGEWPMFRTASRSVMQQQLTQGLKINIRTGQGKILVSLTSELNRQYVLEHKKSLGHALWEQKATMTGNGNDITFEDSVQNENCCYYRVRVD